MNDYNPKLGMSDLVVQGVLLTLVIVPDIFSVFTNNSALLVGMFFQIFLGAYQVFSGVIGGIKQREGRGRYLAVAAVYMFFFGLGILFLENLQIGGSLEMYLLAFCIIAIPVSIAIWYFMTCVKEYQAYKIPGRVIDMPDVLDIELR